MFSIMSRMPARNPGGESARIDPPANDEYVTESRETWTTSS
jgi:hypothetical protein